MDAAPHESPKTTPPSIILRHGYGSRFTVATMAEIPMTKDQDTIRRFLEAWNKPMEYKGASAARSHHPGPRQSCLSRVAARDTTSGQNLSWKALYPSVYPMNTHHKAYATQCIADKSPGDAKGWRATGRRRLMGLARMYMTPRAPQVLAMNPNGLCSSLLNLPPPEMAAIFTVLEVVLDPRPRAVLLPAGMLRPRKDTPRDVRDWRSPGLEGGGPGAGPVWNALAAEDSRTDPSVRMRRV
mmetsp:Transcript_26346/g.76822  ORF Transcript_26346/g.76822 Transcript_26346/m.76822 type:complete len:240 (-) Transcript_26346:101-820(-)